MVAESSSLLINLANKKLSTYNIGVYLFEIRLVRPFWDPLTPLMLLFTPSGIPLHPPLFFERFPMLQASRLCF